MIQVFGMQIFAIEVHSANPIQRDGISIDFYLHFCGELVCATVRISSDGHTDHDHYDQRHGDANDFDGVDSDVHDTSGSALSRRKLLRCAVFVFSLFFHTLTWLSCQAVVQDPVSQPELLCDLDEIHVGNDWKRQDTNCGWVALSVVFHFGCVCLLRIQHFDFDMGAQSHFMRW